MRLPLVFLLIAACIALGFVLGLAYVEWINNPAHPDYEGYSLKSYETSV